MANNFIGEIVKPKGAVEIVVKDCEGNIKFGGKGPSANSLSAMYRQQFACLIVTTQQGASSDMAWPGNLIAITSDLITAGTDYTKNGGGIYVVNTDNAKTQLACTINPSSPSADANRFPPSAYSFYAVNSFSIQGTNQFYDDGVAKNFWIAPDDGAIVAQDYYIASHEPTAGQFNYSSGDTITVNWTISIT